MQNLRKPPVRLRRSVVAVVFAALVALLATTPVAASSSDGAVVVANRGSGNISVIDTATLNVDTYDLPGDAEPMYVNHDTANGRVLVGDRASSTIVAFDDETYDIVGSVPVGAGVFHQWINVDQEQLWVVGTSASTVTVVDTTDLVPITTFALPADVIADGGVPHDVFVANNVAFVSVLGLASGDGLVLQYSATDFTETGRIVTTGDPHLFVRANTLYVASQVGSTISSYNAKTLAPLSSESVPSAHGLFVTARKNVFVTNIAGGGNHAVFQLDGNLTSVESTADTAFPVPHNLAVDNSQQIWVTHSGGTANTVSIMPITKDGLGSAVTVTVGTNPFGLAFVG